MAFPSFNKKVQPRYSESVILLHGLGRTHHSMSKIASALKVAGFRVINLDYPSREKKISALAAEAINRGIEESSQHRAKKLHFVTHSMGGILLRDYLSKNKIKNLGHTVMLSPPNKGSEVVDNLTKRKILRWILGPAGRQLGTDKSSVPLSLKKVDYPVGIIAGNKHAAFDALFSKMIVGEDDGKVSVESTKVEGMVDFLLTDSKHSYIMNDDQVIRQTINFLIKGQFYRR